MAKYVEFDAVIKAAHQASAPISDIIQGLRTLEVVLCKDCESFHFGRCWNGATGGLGANRGVNDFCSYGERKDNGI